MDERKFDPGQPRDDHGRWSFVAAALKALAAAFGPTVGHETFGDANHGDRRGVIAVHDDGTVSISSAGTDGKPEPVLGELSDDHVAGLAEAIRKAVADHRLDPQADGQFGVDDDNGTIWVGFNPDDGITIYDDSEQNETSFSPQTALDLADKLQQIGPLQRAYSAADPTATAPLKPGESLLSRVSIPASPDQDDFRPVVAVVETSDGRRVRLGLVGKSAEDPTGGQGRYVVDLDEPTAGRISAALEEFQAEGEKRRTAYRALAKQGDAIWKELTPLQNRWRSGKDLTDAEEAKRADLHAQLDRLDGQLDAFGDADANFGELEFETPWGTLVLTADGIDDEKGSWGVRLAVKPPGAPGDWQPDVEAAITPDGVTKLIEALGASGPSAARNSATDDLSGRALAALAASRLTATRTEEVRSMDAMTHVPSLGDDAAYEDMLHKLFAGCTDEELDEFGRLADDAHDEAYGSSMPRSRFSKLSAALARKGARDPDALAAYIGRKKYTRKTFAAMASAGHRSAGSAVDAGAEERKYHPGQLRDPEGQWSKGGGVGGAIKDALKLADRIQLGDGESLSGSDVLRADDGSSLPMAWTHGPGGAKLRLGIGIPTDDEKSWRAADKGRTVVLDEAAAHRLAEATRHMREAGAAGEAKSAQLDKRAGELEAKQRELIRRQYPNLTTAQAKELDDLDEEIQDKAGEVASLERSTSEAHAELPEAAKQRSSEIEAEIKRLSAENAQLYQQFWAGGGQDNSILTQTKRRGIQIQDLIDENDDLHKQRESGRRLVGYAHLAKQRRERLERAQRELDIAQSDREELTGDPVPLSAADAAELESTSAELERAYDERIALIDEPVTGIVPAEWGDVAYTVSISDGDGTAGYELGVRPPDAGEDWTLGYGEEGATLTADELAELEHKLTAGPGAAGGTRSTQADDLTTRGLAAIHCLAGPESSPRDTDERQFDASSHPRAPVGSTTGGQFAKAPAQQQPAKAGSSSGGAGSAKKTPVMKGGLAGETEGQTSVKPGAGRRPRHVVIPKGSMGYDPASNHGTGYGSKAGSPKVHTLQDSLNRLGFTDLKGRKLTSDGKLGPLTTSAVRKAQRALGLKADGLVTPELLKKLSDLKSAPNHKSTRKPHAPAHKSTASAHKAGSSAGSKAGSTAHKAATVHKTSTASSSASAKAKAKARAEADAAAAARQRLALAEKQRLALAAKIGAAPPPKPAPTRPRVGRVDAYDPAGRSADLRNFDPSQLRDPHSGEWSKSGSGIGHLIASLAKVGGGDAFSPHDNADAYMDWSRHTGGSYNFEAAGDDGETISFDMPDADLESLHTALTETLIDDADDGGTGETFAGSGAPLIEWEKSDTRLGDQYYTVYISQADPDSEDAEDRISTSMEMSERDIRDWHTQLTITLLTQAAEPPATRSAPHPTRWTHRRAAGQSTKAQTRSLSEMRSAAMSLCTRDFDFEFETRSDGSPTSNSGGDGRTLDGYAAVFNTSTRIRDLQGDFDERILPGAFARSIGQRMPVLQFDHGKDPAVGGAPIGKITHLAEDSKGLHVRARLFADPSISRVREAIAEQAIKGMSFRFGVPQGGDEWKRRNGDVDLREIRDTDIHELGPVVFPAYDATSVSVRSILSGLSAAEVRELVHELRESFGLAVDLRALGEGTADEDQCEDPDCQCAARTNAPTSAAGSFGASFGLDANGRATGGIIRPGRNGAPRTNRSTSDPKDITGRSGARRADGGDDGTPPSSGAPVPNPLSLLAPEEMRLMERALTAIGAL